MTHFVVGERAAPDPQPDGNNLALHRALHIRDFFRTLVDQKHDQIAFRMIGRDRVRDILHQHGFTGPGRRHDQGALAFADRGHDVDNPCRKALAVRARYFPSGWMTI